MNHRWYDTDPTISMAVSLLHNASSAHQEMTAKHVLHYLEREKLVNPDFYQNRHGRIRFIFPLKRRSKFGVHACRMLEIMKRLPLDIQQQAAIQIINYVYLLDCGVDIPEDYEFDTPMQEQNAKVEHP